MPLTVREWRELRDIIHFFPTYDGHENHEMARFWELWMRHVDRPLQYEPNNTSITDEQTDELLEVVQLGKPHESEEAHRDGLEVIETFFGGEAGGDEVQGQPADHETVRGEAVRRGKKKGAEGRGGGGEAAGGEAEERAHGVQEVDEGQAERQVKQMSFGDGGEHVVPCSRDIECAVDRLLRWCK
ncbi:hypothetical protein Tdes44962_MAKER09790 [Teratosphaeria destructans]|uniref:Uncharacterized protein n=1 Tax=Teratosphaeria destructans TaxID=418781 RepID=A0A9W7SRF6_9PEZI|nr:hypothetical protein Tdes44962_MAKER09790 [Teratosphaeria destructans]